VGSRQRHRRQQHANAPPPHESPKPPVDLRASTPHDMSFFIKLRNVFYVILLGFLTSIIGFASSVVLCIYSHLHNLGALRLIRALPVVFSTSHPSVHESSTSTPTASAHHLLMLHECPYHQYLCAFTPYEISFFL